MPLQITTPDGTPVLGRTLLARRELDPEVILHTASTITLMLPPAAWAPIPDACVIEAGAR